MAQTESTEEDRPLNGAVIRVVGGVLVGIGISPVVVFAFDVVLGAVVGDAFVEVFRIGLYLMATVFGLVLLHVVRLFYQGDWRSLESSRTPVRER